MTPLGHASTAYLLGRAAKRVSLPAVVAGGLVPDIDFVLFAFPWFNAIHRVVTHNLVFVVAIAGLLALASKSDRRTAVFVGAMIGGFLHLLLDSCLDSNASNGIGVALLWPLSDQMISPFNLLDPTANPQGWTAPARGFAAAASALPLELPFAAAAAWLWWGRRSAARADPSVLS